MNTSVNKVTLIDGPGIDVASWRTGLVKGIFKDYIRFKPNGNNNIYVTLAKTDWSMWGEWSGARGIFQNSTPEAPHPVDSDEIPTWNNTISKRSSVM
jgi:hypothetical protein